jgi:lysylphosphatidylglycerol synthetase-like protein (DUF2156 family)
MQQQTQAIDPAVGNLSASIFAFDVLQHPSRYRFLQSRRVPGASIPYRSIGKVDVILGDPSLPSGSATAVLAEFFQARESTGRRVLGFSTSEEMMRAAVAAGASATQLTAEPQLDPMTWAPSGGSAKKLRQYVRRLRAQGYTVSALPARNAIIPPEFRAPAEALLAEWKSHLTDRAHILELEPWLRAEEKRYFAVADPGDPQRFLALLIAQPVYAKRGWHLCHIAHSPDAPKGITELVVTAAIEAFAAEGVHYVTFGPCAAPKARRFVGINGVRRFLFRRIYNTVAKHGGYAERAEFYRKMHADAWQPRFMFFYPPTALVRPLIALMQVTHVMESGEFMERPATSSTVVSGMREPQQASSRRP